MLDKGKVAELKGFVGLLEKDPHLLQAPELAFFRQFMERYGATFSPAEQSAAKETTETGDVSSKTTEESAPVQDEPPVSDDEVEEPEGEQQAAEQAAKDRLMEPEDLPVPPKTTKTGELTDEIAERISQLKCEAAEAMEQNNLDRALEKLNEAIAAAPPSSLSYAKRAELLLKMQRPLGCISDCSLAIEVNNNYGKAYRLRGRAYRALGDWFQAHRDIELAQQLDYDPDLTTLQAEISEHWKILDATKRADQRRRDEIKVRNANRQRRRRQAEARRIYNEQKAAEKAAGDSYGAGGFGAGGFGAGGPNFPGGFPGAGFPGAGGPGAAGGMGDMIGNLMGNPDIKKAMENPKVLSALVELMQNPAAFNKYKDDPEIMQALNKFRSSVGQPGADGPQPDATAV